MIWKKGRTKQYLFCFNIKADWKNIKWEERKGAIKWADKSTTNYDMSDFKSYIKNLTRKYLVIKP